ncbi:hypothetical protein EOM09_00290 [bacterium]|nr:hypothetical protein [bacterium]
MKIIVDLFNSLRYGIFLASNVIMRGYSFIIEVTADGVNERGINDVWSMLRDICNMFFILILLIIGISTILGIKKYSYRKNLINVLISAFLINYSKVIIGMMIDFSQIFIVPFNVAISDSIRLVINSAFLLDVGEKNVWAAVLGFLFALAFFSVSIIALVYSLIRLVFIWITIAISPIIVLGYGVPFNKVKQNLKDFFQKFVSFLIGGVLMSFFMWFALYILSVGSTGIADDINNNTYFTTTSLVSEDIEEDVKAGFSGDNLMLMIVSLVFLLYAQKFAISSSKQAGSIAGDLATKVGDIGMKPLNGLKGLGLKSASGISNLGKGISNIGKDYTSSAFGNLKEVGLSSLRNRSNRFDNFMTERGKRIELGNKAYRQERTDRLMFGGTTPKGSLRKETLDSLNQKKSMDLAGLQSSGASVPEIKLAKFNWDLKTKEKEMDLSREKLKKASSTDERDSAQQELNLKRSEYAKLKGDKNKYIKELKNVQFGKVGKLEDSTQLKGVKEIMDNLGDGKNVDFIKDHKNSLDGEGKFKRLSTYERDQVMAEIISKIKSKNLKSEDIKFINNNQAMFRSVSQDVLATMNSEIDKNYKDIPEIQSLKQKIKVTDIFELGDKENKDIEKGKDYQEYKSLINEVFSEVNNIKTETEKDEKLDELDKKGVKEDFKELFKQKADIVIKKRNLEQKTKEISGRRQRLESIIGTSDYSDDYEVSELEEIAKLEEEYEKEKIEYEKLKKQKPIKNIKDLEIGFVKKDKVNEKDNSEENYKGFANGFENNYEGFGDNGGDRKTGGQGGAGSTNYSQSQRKSEDSNSDDWDNNSGFGDGGFGNGEYYNQSQSQRTSENSGSNNQSRNQERSGKSGFTSTNPASGSKAQEFSEVLDNFEKHLKEKKEKSQGKTYQQIKNERIKNTKNEPLKSNNQDQDQRTSEDSNSFNNNFGNNVNSNQGVNSFSDNIKNRKQKIQDDIERKIKKENFKSSFKKEDKINDKGFKKTGPNINNNQNDQKLGNKRPNNVRRGNRGF